MLSGITEKTTTLILRLPSSSREVVDARITMLFDTQREGSTVFDRIVSDPAILGGKPIIKSTRISVEMVMEWIASGASRDDVVKAHPHLAAEDVQQAIGYASQAVKNEVLTIAEIEP